MADEIKRISQITKEATEVPALGYMAFDVPGDFTYKVSGANFFTQVETAAEEAVADAVSVAVASAIEDAQTETNSLTEKATPDDADEFRIADSGDAFAFKKLSWANLKTAILAAVKTLLNITGAAPSFQNRMHAKFNGVGGATILSSGNVASIVRTAPGKYAVLFTDGAPSAHYTVHVTSLAGGYMGGYEAPTALGFTATVTSDTGSYSDVALVSISAIW